LPKEKRIFGKRKRPTQNKQNKRKKLKFCIIKKIINIYILMNVMMTFYI